MECSRQISYINRLLTEFEFKIKLIQLHLAINAILTTECLVTSYGDLNQVTALRTPGFGPRSSFKWPIKFSPLTCTYASDGVSLLAPCFPS